MCYHTVNYFNTLKSIQILTCDFGLGMSNRRITVSTCGLAPQIVQLGKDICINLAVFNEYPCSPFKSPSPKDVSAFQQILLDRHFTAMLRKSKGSDILAACGQLSGAAGA